MGLAMDPLFFMEITDCVKSLIAGYLEENGVELVDIIYRREGSGMVLRLLVDTPDGITMGACEEINNYVGELLDKENVIEDHYLLEVSSPGLDRPIKTDRDYERSLGKKLDVTTYEMVDCKKTHDGILIGMDRENVVLEKDGISTVIPRKLVASARLKVEF